MILRLLDAIYRYYNSWIGRAVIRLYPAYMPGMTTICIDDVHQPCIVSSTDTTFYLSRGVSDGPNTIDVPAKLAEIDAVTLDAETMARQWSFDITKMFKNYHTHTFGRMFTPNELVGLYLGYGIFANDVAAKVTVTYLMDDPVAFTGGEPIDIE